MSGASKIEWTDCTWNPVTGCTKVSPGCKHCYAEAISQRFGRDFSKIELHPERLDAPLHWRKPRMVFVNSMSDLFHDGVPFEFIDRVFAVMALAPQHTFQVLTKRPERMAEYTATLYGRMDRADRLGDLAQEIWPEDGSRGVWQDFVYAPPLKNVWLGTSVENQACADQRIPHLLQCPTAVRFLSCEPLLEHIDISARFGMGICAKCNITTHVQEDACCRCRCALTGGSAKRWVIVGGESGPGARPCRLSWVRSIVRQCREARVACFVKQLGSKPIFPNVSAERAFLDDWPVRGKGGDMTQWPEDLRIREWPQKQEAHA